MCKHILVCTQTHTQPGVGGLTCSQCLEGHYFLSSDGCTACNCLGRTSSCAQNPNITSGPLEICQCPPPYTGDSCGQCLEGWFLSDASGNCERCQCNNRSNACLPGTGVCLVSFPPSSLLPLSSFVPSLPPIIPPSLAPPSPSFVVPSLPPPPPPSLPLSFSACITRPPLCRTVQTTRLVTAVRFVRRDSTTLTQRREEWTANRVPAMLPPPSSKREYANSRSVHSLVPRLPSCRKKLGSLGTRLINA